MAVGQFRKLGTQRRSYCKSRRQGRRVSWLCPQRVRHGAWGLGDGPEQEASGPVGCGRPSVLVSWALGFLGCPWARRPSDCSKRSVRVGSLAYAVGALAL